VSLKEKDFVEMDLSRAPIHGYVDWSWKFFTQYKYRTPVVGIVREVCDNGSLNDFIVKVQWLEKSVKDGTLYIETFKHNISAQMLVPSKEIYYSKALEKFTEKKYEDSELQKILQEDPYL